MRVRDVMSTTVAACALDDTLERAAQLMWDRDCGCIPLVDDAARVIGIVTDRDICMTALMRRLPLAQIHARTAASHCVFVVHEDDPLEVARDLLGRKQVRRLPVVDRNGHLVGIVSLADLAIRVDDDKETLHPKRIADVLAAVSLPRTPSARRYESVIRLREPSDDPHREPDARVSGVPR